MHHENQRIFLKEKRTFETDSFLPQAALRYVCERTPYSLCSVDKTTHFLLTLWNARGSYQKQSGASGGKCALTTTTSHSEAASETAIKHEEGSHPPCTLNKSSSNMEANAHDSFNQKPYCGGIVTSSACTGSAGQRPLLTSREYQRKRSP